MVVVARRTACRRFSGGRVRWEGYCKRGVGWCEGGEECAYDMASVVGLETVREDQRT